MNKKRTAGPWNADGIFVCDEGDNIVCEMSTCTDRAMSDASLIAAAPDLLEALERLEIMSGLAMPYDDPARVFARKVIRKALEEQK